LAQTTLPAVRLPPAPVKKLNLSSLNECRSQRATRLDSSQRVNPIIWLRVMAKEGIFMKRLVTDNLSNLGFGLAILILLIVGFFAFVELRALIESNNLVSHTLIIDDKLTDTLVLLT